MQDAASSRVQFPIEGRLVVRSARGGGIGVMGVATRNPLVGVGFLVQGLAAPVTARHVSDLQSRIAGVQRMRFGPAHEYTHLRLSSTSTLTADCPNYTRMPAR